MAYMQESDWRAVVEQQAAELERLRDRVAQLEPVEQRAREVYDGRADWIPGDGEQAELVSEAGRYILGEA